MPKLQTRQALADSALAAVQSLQIVEYQDQLYIPMDYEDGTFQPDEPERTIWKRQDLRAIRLIGNHLQNILFSNEGEFRSYSFMLKQYATSETPELDLLVPVKGQGIQRLLPTGELVAPTGRFVPSTLGVEYDPDVDTSHVWSVICGWVNSETQATALLRHLSVGLQLGWTASKYILLIGDGSNGKSTLLRMLEALIGKISLSQVTRQEMAAGRPTVTQLNGAVLNIVFDGSRKFLSDSANEKTLIAGEPLSLELKFENIPVTVQTNALFMEGLNKEPKLGDHSGGIQRRIERFLFPNKYEKDLMFEKKLLSNESLSALLKLILQNWVQEHEAGEKLKSTSESIELQIDQIWSNNPMLGYIETLATDAEALYLSIKPNALVDPFVSGFRLWAEQNGYRNYQDDYVRTLLDELFVTVRKTVRINGSPSTRRVIQEWKPALQVVFDTLTKEARDVVSE